MDLGLGRRLDGTEGEDDVGSVTLDVCICTGDGSTSMDNLREPIEERWFEAVDPPPDVIFTSWTLLYWMLVTAVLLLLLLLLRRSAGISATTIDELATGFNWISMLDSMLALRFVLALLDVELTWKEFEDFLDMLD